MVFRSVIARDDLWAGEMVAVRVGDRRVLLIAFDDAVVAYDDRCPHQAHALSEGALSPAGELTCKGHGWCFDARTGAGLNPAGASLERLPVRVEDGEVQVDVG